MSAKTTPSKALSEEQIRDVCYYTQINVNFEVFLDDAGWVLVDWLDQCGTNQIEETLEYLKQQYPNGRIRVIDKTTGRLVDFL